MKRAQPAQNGTPALLLRSVGSGRWGASNLGGDGGDVVDLGSRVASLVAAGVGRVDQTVSDLIGIVPLAVE